jgi:hypothetical protein
MSCDSDLFQPYDTGEMFAYLVDPRVANVRNNDPRLGKA